MGILYSDIITTSSSRSMAVDGVQKDKGTALLMHLGIMGTDDFWLNYLFFVCFLFLGLKIFFQVEMRRNMPILLTSHVPFQFAAHLADFFIPSKPVGLRAQRDLKT